MTRTLNGWTVIASTQLSTIRVGEHSARVRRGDVATVLGWLARQLHHVEPCESLFGYRTPAENARAKGHPKSDHQSGTALDYNGGRHPYEPHPGPWYPGWSAGEVKAVRALLRFLEGVVEWGLDYPVGLRDGMHFGIDSTSTKLARVATKLRGGQVRVTGDGLACRTAPSTKAKVLARREAGYRITYDELLWREGRLWLRSSGGNYYAAEHTSLAGA